MLRFTDFFGDGWAGGARASSLGAVLVIAAHPDDEVAGMGAALTRIPHALVAHITDGAPRNMRDARRLGFSSRDQYASARHEESVKALTIAGIGEEALLELNIPDQTSSYDLAVTTTAITKLVERPLQS